MSLLVLVAGCPGADTSQMQRQDSGLDASGGVDAGADGAVAADTGAPGSDAGELDAGDPTLDTGPGSDAGLPEADSGHDSDSGVPDTDGGSDIDAAAEQDAGDPQDAASEEPDAVSPDSGSDAGVDGGPDAARDPDAGVDAAVSPPDAARPDAGPPDTGRPDAGPPDAGRPDTGPPDSGPPDAGRPDAGPADTGLPDTGPPDTGPPDTGSPDAGPLPDAGPTGGCQYLFCENFDSYPNDTVPPAPWRADNLPAMGQITRVTTQQSFSGGQALRIETAVSGGFFANRRAMITLSGAPVFPLPAQQLHGRVMVYLPTTANFTHSSMVQVRGPVPGYPGSNALGGIGLERMNALQVSYSGTYGMMTGPALGNDCVRTSASRIPMGQWVCLGFTFDTANSTMSFSVNGMNAMDIATTRMSNNLTCVFGAGQYAVPDITTFSLGWEAYPLDFGQARTVFYDDLVLDTSPVSCPP